MDTPKILGQLDPVAATLTTLYTAPAGGAVISTVVVCNRTGSPVACRLSFAVTGAADDPKQYVFYDTPVPANDAIVWRDARVALAVGDVVRGYAATQDLSFNVFGWEL